MLKTITQMSRIEICGGTASGKTTLARRLSEIGGIPLIVERFVEVPFWKEVYESGGAKYVFEKNLGFLLFHAYDIDRSSEQISVCDFAFFQDLAYADLYRNAAESEILEAVFRRIVNRQAKPAVIVDLRCSSTTQLNRIRQRGRAPEASIDEAFLVGLRAAIDARRKQFEQELGLIFIEADSDRSDFLHNDRDVQSLWEQIKPRLG